MGIYAADKLYVGQVVTTKHSGIFVIEKIISSSVKTGGVHVRFLDCGSLRVVDAKSARLGSVAPTKQREIKVGDVFSRLTVLERYSPQGARNTQWLCQCECGSTSTPTTIGLTSGHTTSCGCYRDEIAGQQSVTHGHTNSPTYISWTAMKQRCYYEGKDTYAYYGGRGITICDEWKHDFAKFLEDMGERPDGKTIERLDVNGNYCKENCIWETSSRQGYNTNMFSTNTSGRTGVYLEPKGLWRALIGVENKLLYLGSYATIEKAIEVRAAAEMKYYGFTKESHESSI